MTDLLALNSFVAAQDVEQQWAYPGAFSAEHVNAIDITDKDRLFRSGLRLGKRKMENTRIWLLYANLVGIDDHLKELFNAALLEDRGNTAVRVRYYSQGEAAVAQFSQYPRGRRQHYAPEISLGMGSVEPLDQALGCHSIDAKLSEECSEIRLASGLIRVRDHTAHAPVDLGP